MRADLRRLVPRIISGVIGALVLMGAQCSPEHRPIRIGVAGLFDGLGPARDNLRGMQMALDEANASGGVKGRPVVAVIHNDDASGELAAHVAAEFVNDPSISVVVGHSASAAMLGAATVYDAGLPAIGTTASSPALSGISPWVFRVIPSDSATGAALARFATSRGWQSAAILYQNDVYGRGLANAFRAHFRGRIVGSDPVVASTSDFRPFTRYYARVHPDVVVIVAGRGTTSVAVRRDLAADGVHAAIIASEGAADLSRSSGSAENVFVMAPFSGLDTRPKAHEFIERFRGMFGHLPDHNAALAYDATTMAVAALKAVGPDRQRIREYLASRDATHAIDGVSGPLHFDALGDRIGARPVVLQVQAGRFSLVSDNP